MNIDNYIVDGYAYPSIKEPVLEWWLPRLHWLSTFSYGFTPDGRLVDLDDGALIAASKNASVKTLMTLTPLDSQGKFNDAVAVSVFNNPEAERNLIDEIEGNILTKGMNGINFDFEYVNADYADDYVEMVSKTAARLRPQDLLTTVCLAPKTSSSQEGLLYQGHNYSGMGQVADYCILMTYEWGYTYGPPMAVSPVNSVRKVIEYGVSQIPGKKILMGMSNYGYDWPLPFIKGETSAQLLTNYEAEARAQYYGAPIYFDQLAKSPYFSYKDASDIAHIVWFENQASWEARLSLLDEFDLAGIAIWNIMSIFYGGF